MKLKIYNFLKNILKGFIVCISVLILYKNLSTEYFFGLAGVLLGGVISYFAVIKGLYHSSHENKITRSVEMKKSIYFEASESFSKMMLILANITQIDLKAIGSDVNLISGIQKLSLVARVDLIKKITLCSSYYQKSLQEMILDKMEIDNINNNAKYALDRHSEYLELQLKGLGDVIQLNKKMDECLKYHEEINENLLQKTLNLSAKSIEKVSQFGIMLSECLPDIREDIENGFSDSDKKLYNDFVQKSNNDSLKAGVNFIRDLEERIKKLGFPDL